MPGTPARVRAQAAARQVQQQAAELRRTNADEELDGTPRAQLDLSAVRLVSVFQNQRQIAGRWAGEKHLAYGCEQAEVPDADLARRSPPPAEPCRVRAKNSLPVCVCVSGAAGWRAGTGVLRHAHGCAASPTLTRA